MVRTVSRSPPAPCAEYFSVCPSCTSAKVPVTANAPLATEGCLTAIAPADSLASPASRLCWPISPRRTRSCDSREFGPFILCKNHRFDAATSWAECLKTPLRHNLRHPRERSLQTSKMRQSVAGQELSLSAVRRSRRHLGQLLGRLPTTSTGAMLRP